MSAILTQGMAARAVEIVEPAIRQLIRDRTLKRVDLHLVIVNPFVTIILSF